MEKFKSDCVAVGMSGGVDSSVAAALLKNQGCRVIGFTLLLRDEALKCVSSDDVASAAGVARHIGIDHHVIDARAEFERMIVRYFADSYAEARTPSPCVLCNPTIKFRLVLERAQELGCTQFATGHYARMHEDSNGVRHLYRNRDETKDQSYFLQRLTQYQLQRAIFPLAEMDKDQTRAYAREHALPCAVRSESQDLCFAAKGDYARIVEEYHPQVARGGEIQDSSGRRLGRHNGIHKLTIGQRRGPGVAAGERLYVSKIDPEQGLVVMGNRADCSSSDCTLEDVNWIAGDCPDLDGEFLVRPRYRHRGANAIIGALPDGSVRIQFDQPEFALTPGQAAAIYRGDELLGGGWISNQGDGAD